MCSNLNLLARLTAGCLFCVFMCVCVGPVKHAIQESLIFRFPLFEIVPLGSGAINVCFVFFSFFIDGTMYAEARDGFLMEHSSVSGTSREGGALNHT